jgi:hypothetical protein
MTGRDMPMPDIADRLAVYDLYARQAHLIDGGAADGWAKTFTVDGRFSSPTYGLTAVGRGELAEFAASSNNAALARGQQYRHWVDQLVIQQQGPGEMRVDGYMLIVATTAESTGIERSLRLVDVLRCVDGEWLVASREMFRDGFATPDHH